MLAKEMVMVSITILVLINGAITNRDFLQKTGLD